MKRLNTHRPNPVSYTHLDVYKRQLRSCSDAPASSGPRSQHHKTLKHSIQNFKIVALFIYISATDMSPLRCIGLWFEALVSFIHKIPNNTKIITRFRQIILLLFNTPIYFYQFLWLQSISIYFSHHNEIYSYTKYKTNFTLNNNYYLYAFISNNIRIFNYHGSTSKLLKFLNSIFFTLILFL